MLKYQVATMELCNQHDRHICRWRLLLSWLLLLAVCACLHCYEGLILWPTKFMLTPNIGLYTATSPTQPSLIPNKNVRATTWLYVEFAHTFTLPPTVVVNAPLLYTYLLIFVLIDEINILLAAYIQKVNRPTHAYNCFWMCVSKYHSSVLD